MKMPEKIDNIMLAPCGINCMICYKHLRPKKPCQGCLQGEEGKTEHCIQCYMKECAKSKELTYCFECSDFPCKRIKNIEKSYNKRYEASLIQNALFVKDEGINNFMKNDQTKWKCTSCGGVICIHDAKCSDCGF